MYKRFRATHFRGLGDLELKGLKRINLITGKNNVGKTSLLEAIFLHTGPTNPGLPTTINVFRGMTVYPAQAESIWRWLFGNLQIDSPIALEGVWEPARGEDVPPGPQTSELRISLAPRETVVQVDAGAPPPDDLPLEVLSSAATGVRDLVLSYRMEGHPPVSSRAFLVGKEIHLEPGGAAPPFGSHYHTPLAQLTERDADVYSKVDSRPDGMEPVLDVVKHVEPRIARLVLHHEGAPVIKADIGLPELVPLPFVGQGIVRLFKVAATVASTPGGVILVDEMANGLHYSCLPGVWKGIDYLSRRAQVQVFASTHSRECVAAAYEAFKDKEPFDLGVYRLERRADAVRVIQYDKETLATSLAGRMGVR